MFYENITLLLTVSPTVLSNSSVEIPGGSLKTDGGEILIRMAQRRDYGSEFAKIPIISNNDGTELLLEDIATVKDDFEDSDLFAYYNGKPAVMVNVYRVGKQTPISVSDAVQKHVEKLQESFPKGLNIDVLSDQSTIYRDRMNLLLRNGYIGLALVLVLLGIFLEVRLAFWVTMGIPISFLGCMIFLPMFGVSINMVSMFAFIIALGIVVDDAIVVGENVYNYHQKGVPFLEAAIRGAKEIVMPVTFSVLTNIVAFLPMFFVSGIMGKIFKVIPAVVVTVFAISLFECIFILPAHLGHQKEVSRKGLFGLLHRFQQGFSHWFKHMVRKVYGPFLNFTLRYRYSTVAVGIVILMLVIAVVKSGSLGMTLFPKVESDFAVVNASLPYGTSVEKTAKVQEQLLKAAQKVVVENGGENLVEGIFSMVGASFSTRGGGGAGSSGSHITSVVAYLTSPEIRTIGTEEFVQKWRKEVGTIPGLETLIFQSDAGGPGSGSAVTVELSHRSIEILEKASAELAEELSYFSSVKDIDDGFTPGKPQIDFQLNEKGVSLGLTARYVARQLRNSFYGAEVVRQQRGRNEIKVMVRYPKAERISEYNIEEMIILTPQGKEVALREVADFTRGRAYTSINRRIGRRVVTVACDVNPQKESNKIIEAIQADALPRLMEKYPGLQYSFEGKQADMRESMQGLMYGLGFAVLAIYFLLAIPFKSYVQPLIIMVAIPFGIVGAVIGHIIMGYSLSILSMFGIVALSGVVVNDSLVLIDFANRKRLGGLSVKEAVHSAGIKRFRAIMLTTLSTFFGLCPMIFETSMQARFLIPMAISLGFGIVFSTMITLILVPSLYVMIEDVRAIFSYLYGSETQESATE